MMKNTFYIIALSMILTACGGSSSSDSSKDLFSLWKAVDGSGPLDLTVGGFREDLLFSTYLSDGSQCDCNFVVIGDQESGRYTLNSCGHIQDTGPDDEVANCNALEHTGLYTKTKTELTICDDTQDCTVYK